MSEVNEINRTLTRLSRRIAVASNKYVRACRTAAEKRTEYDVTWARQLLKAQGETVSERQSSTTILVKDEMLAARIAEGERDALKERLRALQSVLNAVQTRARMLSDELKLSGKDY
jgi:hypothetical protein